MLKLCLVTNGAVSYTHLLVHFGIVCTEFPFKPGGETKDLPKRDWSDEDGEDTYIPDVYKRQTIFNQIKKLAVASPFGVMDLNQYAKQLSAYSIPYNELYLSLIHICYIESEVS